MTVTHEEVPGWTEPSATQRLRLLERTSSIAKVGVSKNQARPSNFVATYLMSSSAKFQIYFVNPAVDEILGQRCYASLEELPESPDMVDVFRRSEDLPEVAQQAVAVGAKSLWVQLEI